MRPLLLILPWLATAWRPAPAPARQAPMERRAAFRLVGALGLSVAISPAVAADTPSTAELQKLTIGYSRIQYLLNNWEDLTTTCKGIASDTERKQAIATNAAACSKTPLVVQVIAPSVLLVFRRFVAVADRCRGFDRAQRASQDFIGYKSMSDPLFKADKLMLRAQPLLKKGSDDE